MEEETAEGGFIWIYGGGGANLITGADGHFDYLGGKRKRGLIIYTRPPSNQTSIKQSKHEKEGVRDRHQELIGTQNTLLKISRLK